VKSVIVALLGMGLFIAGCTMKNGEGQSRGPVEKQYIKPSAVIGPYTPAVRAGDLLFVSGQIGLDPATGAMVPGGIEPETRQVLANLDRILKAAGYDSTQVVSATVYLKNMADYATVNKIYATYFPEGRYPARVAVQVAALPKDANIEIAVTACK
jgi:2-iminobutanoate/2-iminopropanoate deaminase